MFLHILSKTTNVEIVLLCGRAFLKNGFFSFFGSCFLVSSLRGKNERTRVLERRKGPKGNPFFQRNPLFVD
ncbi:hypothetical protein DLM78_19300 [Leptospira stimsonii]|uniref:Uncharacterized protein n=1 Tax=Leptospira stimsonii TaxID=2202203 RepID=A0A8B3CLD5_9LEPT|nr:hypothetical protein DLM78_19300 [Leptospira stimsonii]